MADEVDFPANSARLLILPRKLCDAWVKKWRENVLLVSQSYHFLQVIDYCVFITAAYFASFSKKMPFRLEKKKHRTFQHTVNSLKADALVNLSISFFFTKAAR